MREKIEKSTDDTLDQRMQEAAAAVYAALKKAAEMIMDAMSGIWDAIKNFMERAQRLQADINLTYKQEYLFIERQRSAAAATVIKRQDLHWRKQRSQQKNWRKWKKRKY